jgi:hypothetical protein
VAAVENCAVMISLNSLYLSTIRECHLQNHSQVLNVRLAFTLAVNIHGFEKQLLINGVLVEAVKAVNR